MNIRSLCSSSVGTTIANLVARSLAIALLSIPLTSVHAAEKDKAGAKDHSLVSRYAGSILHNYGTSGFEQVELPLGPYEEGDGKSKPTKSLTVEGKVFNYAYWGPANRSDLELFRNYESALAKAGFVIRYACAEPERCRSEGLIKHAVDWTNRTNTFEGGFDGLSRMEDNSHYPPRFLVAQLARSASDVFVALTIAPPSSTEKDRGVGAPYFLQVIEAQPMETGNVTVDASAIQKGLESDGKVALYGVYFDTGAAVVKPESKPQLEQMARWMKEHMAAKVFIVGHTDNVGNFAGNTALSQRRAEAVAQALGTGWGIEPSRMQARGVANLSPVAANASDAQRAKNRRVELVLQ